MATDSTSSMFNGSADTGAVPAFNSDIQAMAALLVDAQADAIDADTSSAAAATSAAAALVSQGAAATSATASAASATASAASQATALTNATVATTQASNALTSAANASTSATNSANSATASAASATLANTLVGTNVGRNKFHNPLFAVAQRGAGPFTGAAYTLDRWRLALNTDANSVTQTALVDADRTAIGDEAATVCLKNVMSSAGAAASLSEIYQRLEDVRRLAGKTVTVSFWAKASSALNIGVWMFQTFGTGGSPSSSVNVAPTTIALTTSWARYQAVIAVPSIIGKTLGTTVNTSYLQVAFAFSSGATNAATLGVGVQSGTFSLWGMQLEVSSTASPLDKTDIREDIANCQRFYNAITTFVGPTATYATTYSFPVRMIAAPAVAGGATGYTTSVLTVDNVVHVQTTGAVANLTFTADL